MLTSEITGDLPEIIGNEENLYEGNLIFYFRILFYKSTNLKNPYHCCPVKPGLPARNDMILNGVLSI